MFRIEQTCLFAITAAVVTVLTLQVGATPTVRSQKPCVDTYEKLQHIRWQYCGATKAFGLAVVRTGSSELSYGILYRNCNCTNKHCAALFCINMQIHCDDTSRFYLIF